METLRMPGFNELSDQEKYQVAQRNYNHFYYLHANRIWMDEDDKERVFNWLHFWETQALFYMPMEIFQEIGVA